MPRKRIKHLALFAASIGALAALPGSASAQLIGPCPSFIMPPPCIIFDYARLAENAKAQVQQIQKIEETIRQVEQTKSSILSIGDDIAKLQPMPTTPIWKSGETFSTVPAGDFASVAQGFADTMYGGTNLGIDAKAGAISKRTAEAIAANSDAFAVAMVTKSSIGETGDRVNALRESISAATNLREDWLANSQIRIEIARQTQMKNQLLGSLLHNASVVAAQKSNSEQAPNVTGARRQPVPARPDQNPGWAALSALRAKEGEIRSALTMLSFASGVETVNEDVKGIISRYQNATQVREQTYKAFTSKAYDLSSKNGSRIVSTTMAALANIDQQMAALRAKPISQLTGAFKERNLDVDELTAAGIDPRQFIGTFADPLKGEWTLNLANSLLDGPLDGPIDGGENDEYRVAIMNLNNARLEEAWMQTHSIEADYLQNETKKIVETERAVSGYDVGSPAAVEAKIRQLVGEANALAQQIQSAGDPTATAQASRVMTSVNGLLNGE
ncbi:MAG: hypothetical protein CL949_20590 [Erythrobacter sp.]|nr:hypothetical protein [Erythrobacter sp.]